MQFFRVGFNVQNGPQRMVFVADRRRLNRSWKGKKATCLTALSGDTGCIQLDHSPTPFDMRDKTKSPQTLRASWVRKSG